MKLCRIRLGETRLGLVRSGYTGLVQVRTC
jgi:hypothetical protein